MKYKKDSLGNRMKQYENCFRQIFTERLPLILRIDGKSFHNYTKSCERPFDQKLINAMNEVAIYLCQNLQGAQLAYIQSDEISILINNYQTIKTQPLFDNNLNKIVSISAGLASAKMTEQSVFIFGKTKLATFDSRSFVLPKEEVVNYFQWRQSDNTRNSVQMLARSLYSHKECNMKNNSQLQEMCFQKGKNWNDLATSLKRGRVVVKEQNIVSMINRKTQQEEMITRSKWIVDNEIPIFFQDRNYIEKFV